MTHENDMTEVKFFFFFAIYLESFLVIVNIYFFTFSFRRKSSSFFFFFSCCCFSSLIKIYHISQCEILIIFVFLSFSLPYFQFLLSNLLLYQMKTIFRTRQRNFRLFFIIISLVIILIQTLPIVDIFFERVRHFRTRKLN